MNVTGAELSFDPASHAESRFNGVIKASAKDSVPDWPKPTKPPPGAPNIVLILLDDIGFADTEIFGGLAHTPELERLAAQGLRYNNFHTTGLCSPTRAALLTGRNHHRVGFGGLSNRAAGYPGYDAVWKESTVSFPEVLRRNGYATAAIGKWHNTPSWEITPLGPFDRWPNSLGFNYFYGFISSGEDSQWEPCNLYRNTTAVEPCGTPEEGYHLTSDIVDDATRWLKTHRTLASEKPYFLYFATGALHYPHHVPRKWVQKYRGAFDSGWDELNREIFRRQKELGVVPSDAQLTPRPAEIPEWSSLSEDQVRLYCRQMEVYAGYIEHTDHEVGRLLHAIEDDPGANNTAIFYIVGDNGTSAEAGVNGFTNFKTAVTDQLPRVDDLGGPTVGMNTYSAGWAWLGSTPFKWWKGVPSHFGGVRDPLIVSWPARISDRGGLRDQFTHVNDIAPTLYEVTGINFPEHVDGIKQQPLDGIGFSHTFDDPKAPSKHLTQYFETFGNRAIYQDGWIAAAAHSVRGWEWGANDPNLEVEQDSWELYNVVKDFSEADDVAERYPGKLKELQELFDKEARENDVYPLGAVLAAFRDQPLSAPQKFEVIYYPDTPRLRVPLVPALSGRAFYRIAADAVITAEDSRGVIMSYGDRISGFVLYVKDRRLTYESVLRNGARQVIVSKTLIPVGPAQLQFEYTRRTEGTRGSWLEFSPATGSGRLFINGQECAEGAITDELLFGGLGTVGIGRYFGSPVSDALPRSFEFTGVLAKVTVQVGAT
jgi:arylsulfatase A-like enzyme